MDDSGPLPPVAWRVLKRDLPPSLRFLSYLHQHSWEAEMSPLGPSGRKGLEEEIKGMSDEMLICFWKLVGVAATRVSGVF